MGRYIECITGQVTCDLNIICTVKWTERVHLAKMKGPLRTRVLLSAYCLLTANENKLKGIVWICWNALLVHLDTRFNTQDGERTTSVAFHRPYVSLWGHNKGHFLLGKNQTFIWSTDNLFLNVCQPQLSPDSSQHQVNQIQLIGSMNQIFNDTLAFPS